jgi:hypothetical protein
LYERSRSRTGASLSMRSACASATACASVTRFSNRRLELPFSRMYRTSSPAFVASALTCASRASTRGAMGGHPRDAHSARYADRSRDVADAGSS